MARLGRFLFVSAAELQSWSRIHCLTIPIRQRCRRMKPKGGGKPRIFLCWILRVDTPSNTAHSAAEIRQSSGSIHRRSIPSRLISLMPIPVSSFHPRVIPRHPEKVGETTLRDEVDNARWFAFLLGWLMEEHARRDIGKIFKTLPRREGAAMLRGLQFTACLREGGDVHERCAYRSEESGCSDPVQCPRYCTCRRIPLERFIRMLFPMGAESVPISVRGKNEVPRYDRRRWHAWLTEEEPLPIRDALVATHFALQAGLIDSHIAEINARYFALVARVVKELQCVKASLKGWNRLFVERKSLCLTQPASNLYPDTAAMPAIRELGPDENPWGVPDGAPLPGLGAQHPTEPWSKCMPRSRVMLWDHKLMEVTILSTAYPLPSLDASPFDSSTVAVRMLLIPLGPDLAPKTLRCPGPRARK